MRSGLLVMINIMKWGQKWEMGSNLPLAFAKKSARKSVCYLFVLAAGGLQRSKRSINLPPTILRHDSGHAPTITGKGHGRLLLRLEFRPARSCPDGHKVRRPDSDTPSPATDIPLTQIVEPVSPACGPVAKIFIIQRFGQRKVTGIEQQFRQVAIEISRMVQRCGFDHGFTQEGAADYGQGARQIALQPGAGLARKIRNDGAGIRFGQVVADQPDFDLLILYSPPELINCTKAGSASVTATTWFASPALNNAFSRVRSAPASISTSSAAR